MIEKIGMTVEEAAGYTGIGRNTLRNLVNCGKLPVLRVGRKSIIRTDILLQYQAKGCGDRANEAKQNSHGRFR